MYSLIFGDLPKHMDKNSIKKIFVKIIPIYFLPPWRWNWIRIQIENGSDP